MRYLLGFFSCCLLEAARAFIYGLVAGGELDVPIEADVSFGTIVEACGFVSIPKSIGKDIEMNWDRVAGNWKQMKGKAKEKWAKLTNDDLTYVDGKRDQLVGRIQERYGIQKDIAEKQLKEWESTL